MSARPLWAWVGFAAGPFCWFCQQQLSYWLQPASCRGRGWLEPAIDVAFLILLALAVVASFRTLGYRAQDGGVQKAEHRAQFVSVVGTIMPLIFLVAMLWQTAASLIYSPCD